MVIKLSSPKSVIFNSFSGHFGIPVGVDEGANEIDGVGDGTDDGSWEIVGSTVLGLYVENEVEGA